MSGTLAVRQTIQQIFTVPLLIAVISTIGLISALVGDGWYDTVSWLTLGAPVALYLMYYVLRKAR